jgi:hypothetical protein
MNEVVYAIALIGASAGLLSLCTTMAAAQRVKRERRAANRVAHDALLYLAGAAGLRPWEIIDLATEPSRAEALARKINDAGERGQTRHLAVPELRSRFLHGRRDWGSPLHWRESSVADIALDVYATERLVQDIVIGGLILIKALEGDSRQRG